MHIRCIAAISFVLLADMPLAHPVASSAFGVSLHEVAFVLGMHLQGVAWYRSKIPQAHSLQKAGASHTVVARARRAFSGSDAM